MTPTPFTDDSDLRRFLGLPDTGDGDRTLARLSDEDRALFATMQEIENEIDEGRGRR